MPEDPHGPTGPLCAVYWRLGSIPGGGRDGGGAGAEPVESFQRSRCYIGVLMVLLAISTGRAQAGRVEEIDEDRRFPCTIHVQ